MDNLTDIIENLPEEEIEYYAIVYKNFTLGSVMIKAIDEENARYKIHEEMKIGKILYLKRSSETNVRIMGNGF